MDRKNHDYLQDDLVEYVEVTDEELEEGMGHNPETAPHDSVKSVSAAGTTSKKQPLRTGDKQNSEKMQKAGAKVREAIMAKESVELDEFTLEELEDFMVSEDFDQLDEISKKTLVSYVRKAGPSAEKLMRKSDKTSDATHNAARTMKRGAADAFIKKGDAEADRLNAKGTKRFAGIKKATDRLTKEDFDFEEDLNALVESEATLSESFREKAEVIFEAALSSKLAEHVERLEEDYQTQLDEQVQEIQESLVEKIDGYLNYVVESWVEENKLAIGNGLRTEIAESFMSALHGVFTEHYIQVPDEKVDLVDGLAEKIEELEEQLNKSVQYNIGLTEAVNEFARESVIRESAKDLSAAQGERLRSLVEDIAFDSEDAFAQKVETVKNSYFRKVSVQTQSEDEQLDEGTAKQLEVSPIMQTYLAALKK
jgi:hypothetical protein